MRSDTERLERQVKAAAKALHEKYCGSPPSCGSSTPCREAEINRCDLRIAIRAAMDATDPNAEEESDDLRQEHQ